MRSAREALRLDPTSAFGLSTLSETLLVAGRFGEAVPALERVADGHGSDGQGMPAALMCTTRACSPKPGGWPCNVAPLTPPAAGSPTGMTATHLAARALAYDRPALAGESTSWSGRPSRLARADDLDAGHRYKAAVPRRGPAAAGARTSRSPTMPTVPNCGGWPSDG